MKTYEISEEEYNELKVKKPFKTNCTIEEGDRLYLLKNCKINKYYLDEYLENNYDNVALTDNIHNANIIIANSSNFNYVVDIGFAHNDLLFRNEEQWKLYLSRLKGKSPKGENKKNEEGEIQLLSQAYKKKPTGPTVDYSEAKQIPYITLYSDDLLVEIIKEYNNNILKVIDENYLIAKINLTNDDSQYTISNVDDIHYLILSAKNNADYIAVVESVNKLHRDTIIAKILPFYYREDVNINMKKFLKSEVFAHIKHVKDVILEPEKATFSNYRHCSNNIKKIEHKTKIKIDSEILKKCFLNENI